MRLATPSRRGMTLVEVIMAMTLLMLVAAVAAVLIESLLRIEYSSREHAANQMAQTQVAHAFRKDVRSFSVVSPVGSETRLTLADRESDHAVSYRIEGDHLTRYEWEGCEVTQQNSFPLPRKSSLRFQRIEEDGRIVYSLLLDRVVGKLQGETTIRPLRIDAILGADLRFERRLP